MELARRYFSRSILDRTQRLDDQTQDPSRGLSPRRSCHEATHKPLCLGARGGLRVTHTRSRPGPHHSVEKGVGVWAVENRFVHAKVVLPRQHALAESQAQRSDLPVPVSAAPRSV
eukprot:2894130-Rhodomonas_salina.1